MLKLDDVRNSINSRAELTVKGTFNMGTHINFPREEKEIYYSVDIKYGKDIKKMVLPEWFINAMFETDQQIVERQKIENDRIEAIKQSAADKIIAEQAALVKRDGAFYDGNR